MELAPIISAKETPVKPFVSYAQNLEDVMLYRALKHVEKGFYIDVGAWRPVDDSVTKAFYDRGWKGINIEPVLDHFHLLVASRKRDINLDLVVHRSTGRIEFNEVFDSGVSSIHKALAQGHKHTSYTKKCDTLANICAAHVTGEIHFLKIDAEGAEEDVLAGMDFTRYRPWIVLLEAVDPDGKPSHGWEPALLEAGYLFAYFDGLNRFYVSKEHAELKRAFQTPPNVFDYYVKYRETVRGFGWRAWRRIERVLG